MTKELGYQVEIFNKEEALEYFKTSSYEDCRINAYPAFTEYHGINRTPISFLMVDLDLKDFADEKDPKKKGKIVLDKHYKPASAGPRINPRLEDIAIFPKFLLLVLSDERSAR